MNTIYIDISGLVATPEAGAMIVSDNTGYQIHFDFDAQWDDQGPKTAIFTWLRDSLFYSKQVPFTGDTVAVPAIPATRRLLVGVTAGDLLTTTPAVIRCESSITSSGDQVPEISTDQQYEALRQRLRESDGASAYTLALESGYAGTIEQWLAPIRQDLTDAQLAEIQAGLTALLLEADTEATEDSILQQIDLALTYKALILAAIRGKGVEVPGEPPLGAIPQLIEDLETKPEFNLAYGDTAPADTGKLWVKCPAPEAVRVTAAPVVGKEDLAEFVAALPFPYWSVPAAAVGKHVYYFGKIRDSSDGATNGILRYDPETNTLTALDIPAWKPKFHMAPAVVGTKIYLFGGDRGGAVNEVWVFDTELETVTASAATLPTAAFGIATAVYGKLVYLFGGFTASETATDTVRVFDTESEAFTTLSAKLPNVSGHISVTAVGTKAYLFGGYHSDSIRVFDMETNTLSTLSETLPKKMYHIALGAVGAKIYLFGGYDHSFQHENGIWVFDTQTNALTQLSTALPNAAYSIAAAAVGSQIYLLGGYNADGSAGMNTVHKFSVGLPLAENHLLVEAGGTEHLFPLLEDVELGVKNVYRGTADGLAEKVTAYMYKKAEYAEYYTSSAKETKSTALTASVSCNVGDLVVAAIVTRDTLTLSSGWTLVSTSNANSNDTNGQRLSWAYKFAESTTESITVTQASSQRMYINMVALRGATGITDQGYTYYDGIACGDTGSLPKPDGLALWGLSSTLWQNPAPYPIWTGPEGIPIIQLGANTTSRLGLALDQTRNDDVTFDTNADFSSGYMIVGCLTVQGMPAFYTGTPGVDHVWEEI